MKEEKVEDKKQRFEITEVATQTTPVIKDNETGEMYNELTILCKLSNDINELKKLL